MVCQRSLPVDRGCATAIIIFVLGLGALLPWNFFMTATKYFNGRLRVDGVNVTGPPVDGNSSNLTTVVGTTKDYRFDSWLSFLSKVPLLLFTLLNSFLYQWVRERVRITFSLVSTLLLFSLTAAMVRLPLEPDSFFSVTMAIIWFINTFSAVLQGSLFGLVGQLPPRYSTLFMSGQGLAGIFAALASLFSILSNGDERTAALGYFITPCVATLGALLCYLSLPYLEFAQFYLNRSQDNKRETANELITEKAPLDFDGCTNAISDKGLEASGSEKGQVSTDKGLEASGSEKGQVSTETAESQTRSSVLAVFKKIWVMALCVTCVFAVTLSVFPVITVRVQTVYKHNTMWDKLFICVCCFIVFNVMDLAGRSAPSLVQWPPKESRLFPVAVVSRVVFIPLLMLCNIPHSKLTVLFSHDGAYVAIMTLFALSNGYFACLSMSYAPQLVRSQDCETAGALMMFFLALGLSLGASFSFLLGKLV